MQGNTSTNKLTLRIGIGRNNGVLVKIEIDAIFRIFNGRFSQQNPQRNTGDY